MRIENLFVIRIEVGITPQERCNEERLLVRTLIPIKKFNYSKSKAASFAHVANVSLSFSESFAFV